MITLVTVAAIASAVVGGVFFAFSTFVMGALARLERAEGIRAMQSINVVVINPRFFAAFFGAALLSIAAVIVTFATGDGTGRTAIVVGAAAYLVGCIGVTVAGNVPLNDRLAAVDAETDEGARTWDEYLVRWTRFNHVRTVACVVASVAFTIAALDLEG